MGIIQKSILMPFSPSEMYNIVNDVKSYPKFLPWCVGSEVLYQDKTSMRASISIEKGRFSYSLTTSNRLVPDRIIELDFAEGPFKYLRGKWQFEPADQGCSVSLELNFEAENKFLDFALSSASRPVAAKLMQSFEDRAYVICG